jgi:hypothetical protein
VLSCPEREGLKRCNEEALDAGCSRRDFDHNRLLPARNLRRAGEILNHSCIVARAADRRTYDSHEAPRTRPHRVQ